MQSYRSHEIIVHNHLIRDRVNESGEKVFGGKNDERISFILDGCFPFGFFNLYGISTQYKKQAAAFFLRLFFFSFELKKNHSLTFIWILTVKICPFAIYVYGIHRAYDIYILWMKKKHIIFVACCRGVSFHIALQSFPIMFRMAHAHASYWRLYNAFEYVQYTRMEHFIKFCRPPVHSWCMHSTSFKANRKNGQKGNKQN